MDDLLKQEGYNLVGAAFEVYNELGGGLLEEIYLLALEHELSIRTIPFSSKQALNVYYKGVLLNKTYIPDLFVYDGIMTELKAVKKLLDEHEAQLINYMRITKSRVGYLLNFGNTTKLDWKRFVI